MDNRPKAEQGPVFLGFLKCKVLSVIIYRGKCGLAFLPTVGLGINKGLARNKKTARRRCALLECPELKLENYEILFYERKVDSIHKIPIDGSPEPKLKFRSNAAERSTPQATQRLKNTLIRCLQRALSGRIFLYPRITPDGYGYSEQTIRTF